MTERPFIVSVEVVTDNLEPDRAILKGEWDDGFVATLPMNRATAEHMVLDGEFVRHVLESTRRRVVAEP